MLIHAAIVFRKCCDKQIEIIGASGTSEDNNKEFGSPGKDKVVRLKLL